MSIEVLIDRSETKNTLDVIKVGDFDEIVVDKSHLNEIVLNKSAGRSKVKSEKLMTGAQFNELGLKVYKLTNVSGIHREINYNAGGLIIDTVEWNPSKCNVGMYAVKASQFYRWLDYSSLIGKMYWCWTVTAPDDARVYVESALKIRFDKYILSNRRLISELDEWKDDNFVNAALHHSAKSFTYITNPTAAQIHKALIKNTRYMTSVDTAAVRDAVLAECITTIGNRHTAGRLMRLYPDTPINKDMLTTLLSIYPCNIEYIDNQTPDQQLLAVTKTPYAIVGCRQPCVRAQMIIVNKKPKLLADIDKVDPDVQMHAVKRDPLYIRFIMNPNRDTIDAVLETKPNIFAEIADINHDDDDSDSDDSCDDCGESADSCICSPPTSKSIYVNDK